jgi:hypothetical protein
MQQQGETGWTCQELIEIVTPLWITQLECDEHCANQLLALDGFECLKDRQSINIRKSMLKSFQQLN